MNLVRRSEATLVPEDVLPPLHSFLFQTCPFHENAKRGRKGGIDPDLETSTMALRDAADASQEIMLPTLSAEFLNAAVDDGGSKARGP